MDGNRMEIKRVAKEMQFQHSETMGSLYFHGKSMLPFLREADEVTVFPVSWEDISKGDIITYQDRNKFPTYRVYKKKDKELILKADNWYAFFEVSKENVLGKVAKRKRGAREISCDDLFWRMSTKHVFLKDWIWEKRKSLLYHLRLIMGPKRRK